MSSFFSVERIDEVFKEEIQPTVFEDLRDFLIDLENKSVEEGKANNEQGEASASSGVTWMPS